MFGKIFFHSNFRCVQTFLKNNTLVALKYSRKKSVGVWKYRWNYVHCSIIYNTQDQETIQVPINRWVDKKAAVHLHNRVLLNHKKEGNLTFYNSMDEPGEYYAKWNQPVRERQILYDLTYVWNLMNKINWWTK